MRIIGTSHLVVVVTASRRSYGDAMMNIATLDDYDLRLVTHDRVKPTVVWFWETTPGGGDLLVLLEDLQSWRSSLFETE
jgi:hypothetical protein